MPSPKGGEAGLSSLYLQLMSFIGQGLPLWGWGMQFLVGSRRQVLVPLEAMVPAALVRGQRGINATAICTQGLAHRNTPKNRSARWHM